jgi:hypothetical protein
MYSSEEHQRAIQSQQSCVCYFISTLMDMSDLVMNLTSDLRDLENSLMC